MPDALPALRLPQDRTPVQDHSAGLPDIPVCRVSAHLQSTHGHPLQDLEYPTDIVRLVVLWRLRYKLSLRDLAEMFLERGFVLTTRPSASGRSGLHRCSRSDSAPNDGAKIRRPRHGVGMRYFTPTPISSSHGPSKPEGPSNARSACSISSQAAFWPA